MANDNQSLFPSYGNHFRCFLELIKSNAAFRLFLWICDEHSMLKKMHANTLIKKSERYMVKKSNISRNSFSEALDKLVKWGFIFRHDDGAISLNEVAVWSVVKAFEAIKHDNTQQSQFYNAFNADTPDFAILRRLGYKELEANDALSLSDLSGSVLTQVDQNCATDENGSKMSHPDSEVAQKSTTNGSVLSQFSDSFEEMAQFCATILADLYTKRELFGEIEEINGSKLSQSERENLISAIFDGNGSLLSQFSPEMIGILMFLSGSKMSQWVAQNCATRGSKMSHSNKYIINKIIKEKPQAEGLGQKGKENEDEVEEDFEDEDPVEETSSFINKILDFQEEQEREKAKEEEDNKLDIDRYTSSNQVVLSFQQSQLQKEIKRRNRNYPYFSPADVNIWIHNLGACIDRPEKLFLYYICELVNDKYGTYTDEEGNEQESWVFGHAPIPENDLYSGFVKLAIKYVVMAAEQGYADNKHEKYDLQFTTEDIDEEKLMLIIDWEKKQLDENSVVFSTSCDNLRNPFAQPIEKPDIPSIPRRRGSAELMRPDREYLRKLWLVGQYDESNDILSEMENVIFNFLIEYYPYNDVGVMPRFMDLPKLQQGDLNKFWKEEAESNPDRKKLEKDFYDCLLFPSDYKITALHLRSVMFSQARVEYWNSMHGYESKLKDMTIPELLDKYGLPQDEPEPEEVEVSVEDDDEDND